MAFFTVLGLIKLVALLVLSNIVARYEQQRQEHAAQEDAAASKGLGVLVNTSSTGSKKPLLYGYCRVGGNRAYAGTTGSDNQYVHLIYTLGEGPINGWHQVDGVDQLFLDGKLWTDWGSDYVHYELFTGTADQTVCATLNAAIPEWTDCYQYTAYLYLRLKWDSNKWLGIPDVTCGLEGLLLYDPDLDSIFFSPNDALVLYDRLTRPSVRGGMGIGKWHEAQTTERIDVASVAAARDYCNTKGWTFNAPITLGKGFTDSIQPILNCFRGEIIYSQTKYFIKYHDLGYENTVMDLTMDDVARGSDTSSLSIKPVATLQDRPNKVVATFYSSELNWVKDQYSLMDPDAVTSGEDERELSIDLPGLNDLSLVKPMADYVLERARWGHKATGSFRDRCAQLDVSDLVTLTHDIPGWTSRTFRVGQVDLDPATHLTALTLIEEKAELYDQVYNPLAKTRYETTLPDPTGAVAGVINVTEAQESYDYRGRTFTRWNIGFSAPAATDYPWWKHANIWIRINGGAWKFQTTSQGDYQLDPVQEGATYDCKIQSVNVYGVEQDFNSAHTVSRTIQDGISAPGSISDLAAVANGDSVSLFATPLTDPDIDGYETRIGSSWDGGIFLSYDKSCNIRLAGLHPGTYTFWVAPRNNSGTYGTAVSATATVFIPPGFSSLDAWTWDFNGIGTFSNTEYALYGTDDALKCSHTSGVLTGTWTSPTRDLGAVEKVRVWGDFVTDFVSSAGTFGGVLPDPADFASVDAADRSFAEIFASTGAGQLKASLFYSTDGTNFTEVKYFALQAAEVEARYIYVVISLTDPTLDSNLYCLALNMSAYTGIA